MLLIFIAQNTELCRLRVPRMDTGAFRVEWRFSSAAVGGGLLTVAAGTARIVQLRRAAKKNLKAGL